MRRAAAIFAAVLLLGAAPGPARADQVLLKNGSELEGLITSESPAEVVLDFGYGTTVLRREDIRSIRRSGAEQRQALKRRHLRLAAETGSIVPRGAEKLSELLQTTLRARETAQEANRRRERLAAEDEQTQEELSRLKALHPELARELGQTGRGRQNYNDLVDRANSVAARIQASLYALEENARLREADDGAVAAYFSAVAELRRRSDKDLPRLRKLHRDEASAAFFAEVARKLSDMETDFARESVASRGDGNQLVVDVLFNGKVSTPLLVDTGATQTVISPMLARRLGIDPSSGTPVQGTVADGRKVDGRRVVVDSIAVGQSRLNKYPVTIMAAPGPGLEGLLGMSFLSRFMFRLDLPHRRLILESLKPSAAAPDRP